jgi:hypothetical protein
MPAFSAMLASVHNVESGLQTGQLSFERTIKYLGIFSVVCPSMTVGTQSKDLGWMIWTIIRQSRRVVRFDIRASVCLTKRSDRIAALGIPIGSAQNVQMKCFRPNYLPASGRKPRRNERQAVVYTENVIRVDDAPESPKLAE